jgi:hypothetical protein
MNAKREQIQTGSSVNESENKIVKATNASATELTEVTDAELNQVDGGSSVLASHVKVFTRDPNYIGGRSG